MEWELIKPLLPLKIYCEQSCFRNEPTGSTGATT